MVYPISKWIVPPVYNLWLREVHGLENLPKDVSFIIAANHASYYDSMLLHCILLQRINKKIHAFSKSRYFKNPMTRIFMKWGGNIPVYVEKEGDSRKKNELAFKKAIDYLNKGDLIEIFPEGRRSPDGRLGRAYTGVAKLALMAKAPVVPIGIIDSHKVLPSGNLFPRFKRCNVKIGKPIYFEKYYNGFGNSTFESVTREVMQRIAKLIGQEYNY